LPNLLILRRCIYGVQVCVIMC